MEDFQLSENVSYKAIVEQFADAFASMDVVDIPQGVARCLKCGEADSFARALKMLGKIEHAVFYLDAHVSDDDYPGYESHYGLDNILEVREYIEDL